MHDYYRIAEISGARRTRARAVPAWAVVLHAMPPARRNPEGASAGATLHLVRALEPERPSERALRDEVALDFPSVRQAIDQARRDFDDVEGPGVAMHVDLALTPLQARRSARVPLRLHLPAVCEPCGGRGEVWDDPCTHCGGTGATVATRYVVVRVPAHSAHDTVLRYRLALPYGPRVRLDVRLAVR
ncbi:hypothetical protein TBR22_A46970 [Luteitalea sp. TBR-22]|uniref:hypothetical protein n=1 Tax=Luteitalea sp. TBR-22 TaxID=2802971 RepID=UPI001AFC71F3|nr:hypothetical protein [Luteitalea sp. TBR-22]BCS35470.1 hypothetical protein TBR22_A46970 [Luteitalea sp. TBR-22]